MSQMPRTTTIGGALENADERATDIAAPGPLAVCHLISGDAWAGAEVQASGLVRALSRRPDLRLSAIVLNEGRLSKELRASGVEVCVIPESSNSFFQTLAEAARFVRSQQPSILHSHRYKENLLALLLACRCRVPVKIRTQHGLPEPFQGIKAARHAAVQCFDRFSGRFWTDSVISVSAEMMPELRRIYGRRTVLVRNGIDISQVRSALTREQAKRKLDLPEHVPVVGLIGRLEPVKRADLFLETAVALAKRLPSTQFVLAGTGHMEKSLKQQAAKSELGERVRFLGHRDDVYDVLRALDVLVMCSDHEGLPMVLLEALWLGVPVVARRVGGIKEVLGTGIDECGLTVASSRPDDLAAACQCLIEDEELRDRLCRAAAKRIEAEFSLDRTVEEVVNQYRNLAGAKKVEFL